MIIIFDVIRWNETYFNLVSQNHLSQIPHSNVISWCESVISVGHYSIMKQIGFHFRGIPNEDVPTSKISRFLQNGKIPRNFNFFFQFTENSILAHLLRRKFKGWKWREETKCSSYLHTCLNSDYPYMWQTGNWSRCSTKCGSGKQTRKLDCAKTGGGKVDSKFCRNTKIPAGSRACYGKLCGKMLSCYDSMYIKKI